MTKQFTVQDKFFHKAKKEGYMARSVFKLEEIQGRFRLMRPGDRVLDLGCAPGSWLQYISKLVGNDGQVLGLDLTKVNGKSLGHNISAYVCDIYDEKALNEILGNALFNTVTSDAAPNTSGVHDIDCARSEELCLQIVKVASQYLRKGGNFVMKIFQGEDFGKVVNETKKIFKKVTCFKPKACRDRSRETYIIGIYKI